MRSWRQALAGYLLLAMILITVLTGLFPISTPFNPLWLAGLSGWLAGMLLFKDAPLKLKIQVSLILVIGLALLLYALGQSDSIDFHQIVTTNTGLLSMIAAVGFLRLVVLPTSADPDPDALPTGKKAFLQTLIGLNISSSIINISAPILISDRVHQHRPLDRFTAQTFVRIFCGVSSWSPFFAAMAVVLTYVEGAQLRWVIVAGLPFTLAGFLLVYVEANIRYKKEIETFVGYPMKIDALKVPLALIVTVFTATLLLPETSILVLIALSALLITGITLSLRFRPSKARDRLSEYVTQGLPRIVNELTLFLVAGVLSTGIATLIQQGIWSNPMSEFTPLSATGLLLIMWLFAAIGVHPVIMISGFAPMIIALDPNPNLLAATFLFAWHLGTCSSPLSGTNLVFQGRYNIPSWKLALWNWPYALVMLVVAFFWLQLVVKILPAS